MQTGRRSAGAVFVALFALGVPVLAADPAATGIRLPEPDGPYPVGTKVWHWERHQSGEAGPVLEVMGQLWYPGDAVAGAPARYRPLGGGPFESVQQHGIGAAPFATLPGKAPLILVCPGRGIHRSYYTSIAENLASRGFAVLGVDIPRIGYAAFPDGRIIEPAEDYRPSFELITGPYEKVDAFFEPAVAIGLKHLDLALDSLAALNRDDPSAVLTGRLDLRSIGAFGHSLGGRLCGAFAGSDERVAAFAAMEGVPPPQYRRNGISAASLMLYSSELPEDMALPNIRELYDNRIAEATILRLEGFGHNSVTDQPLIFPERFDYEVAARKGLDISRTILAQFFEAHLMEGEFSPARLATVPEVSLVESSVVAVRANR